MGDKNDSNPPSLPARYSGSIPSVTGGVPVQSGGEKNTTTEPLIERLRRRLLDRADIILLIAWTFLVAFVAFFAGRGSHNLAFSPPDEAADVASPGVEEAVPAEDPPPGEGEEWYRVRSGDTLGSIAQRNNVSPEALRTRNSKLLDRWEGICREKTRKGDRCRDTVWRGKRIVIPRRE